MKITHQVVFDSFKFFTGTIVANIFLFIQGIIVARVLGPSWFGIWSIFMVILNYSHHSHLGIIHGMNKEVPYLRGRKNYEVAKNIIDTSFWATALIGAFISIIILIISFIFRNIFSHEIVSSLQIIALAVFFYIIYLFLISLLRVDKNFNLLSFSVATMPFVSLVVMITLFKFLTNKLHAALWGLMISYLSIVIIILLISNYRFRLSLNIKILKKTFFIGLPLIIISLGYALYISLDRWLVAKFLDRFQLSYYALGATFGHFLVGLISVVAFVLYPRMLERYGETNEIKSLKKMTLTSAFFISYIMAMAVTFGVIIIPVFIRLLLPAYLPAISTINILLLAVYFLSFSPIMGNCLISINYQKKIISNQLTAFLLCLVTDYLLLKNGFGISYIALGTGFSFFFYSISLTYSVLRFFFADLKEIITEILKIYFPFLVNIFLLFMLPVFFKTSYNLFFKNPLIELSVKLIFYCLVNTYLLLHLNKKYIFFESLLSGETKK